jgi:hypothetical protein
MIIVKNENFLVNSFVSNPIYRVLDENENILFNGVTEKECLDYIERIENESSRL